MRRHRRCRAGPSAAPKCARSSARPTSPESEDCLTLNVWTPGPAGDGATRPVMVWLHGGAFAYGSGNRAVTDGANLARRGDVVVVSVNHRLNIFGFLDLAEIGGERYAHSGNAGVLDLVAALRMGARQYRGVRRRSAQRHDLRRVGRRRKGQRAAGDAGARGLFHRAVIQSGAAIRVRTSERAAALTDAVMKYLGIARRDCELLHEVPADRLAAAIAPASRAVGRPELPLLDRYDFGPTVDGTDLPMQPFEPGGAGDRARHPAADRRHARGKRLLSCR